MDRRTFMAATGAAGFVPTALMADEAKKDEDAEKFTAGSSPDEPPVVAKDMVGQFLAPFGLNIADGFPLAYVRGNHDVRGPAARHVPDFTGTPKDDFYYAFRSGPVAALVMDTGEDKPDDNTLPIKRQRNARSPPASSRRAFT